VKKPIDCNGKHVLISRTDSIGDVMLTLPLVAWLKETYPTCSITFLCRNYTEKIVHCYEKVDSILTLDALQAFSPTEQIQRIRDLKIDIAIHVFPRKSLAHLLKKAGVPVRIGTSHRLFHLLTCNVRPNFTRKRSPLHEAQLNFELLRPIGVQHVPDLSRLNSLTKQFKAPVTLFPSSIEVLLTSGLPLAVLHPKSQGSAREWPIENYLQLAEQLIQRNYTIVFTGTEKEGAMFREQLPHHPHIVDSTGLLSIEQLIALIGRSQVLVACSTGPLHIAGFLGKRAIGIFSPRIPIHPGRWKPLGENAVTVVYDENCVTCNNGEDCSCITRIAPERIIELIP
jgi:heptosyltransferase III